MVPAVRIVIEGDGILPTLSHDPVLRSHAATGRLRFCCVVPDIVDALLVNARTRGRGIGDLVAEEQIRQAEMNIAFGQWLAEEAARWTVPVVRSRPLVTLAQRIVAAARTS